MGQNRPSGRSVTLPQFMQRALKHGTNNREEERELVGRMQEGDADARETLVMSNLRFILKQAIAHSRWGGIDLDDAVQEAAIGHIEALERFRTSEGTRLSTYSAWWIRHAVLRFAQDHGRNVRIPTNALAKAKKISRAAQRFERMHGRSPDDGELSAITGISQDWIDRIRVAVMETVSLDDLRSDAEGNRRSLQDILPDDGMDQEEALRIVRDTERLAAAMASLTPFEAAIIRCRFYDDMTLVETAEALAPRSRRGKALSRERIRQLENSALEKLRSKLTAA